MPGRTDGTALFGEPMRTALVYLAHVRELEDELDSDDDDRRRVVSLWTDLTTDGPQPLYDELFLGRPVAQRDPAFAAPLGDVLSAAAVGTGDAALSAPTYRRCRARSVCVCRTSRTSPLATAMRGRRCRSRSRSCPSCTGTRSSPPRSTGRSATCSALERLSGIDPFHPLDADPLTSTADDHALQDTLAFVRIATQLVSSGLTIAELDYLLAHRVDPTNDLRPDADETATLLATVASKLTEALARLAAAPTDADLPPANPPATTPPPPPSTPPEIASALVAAALGPRAGLVASLLSGDDALVDPSAPADAPVPLVDAFLSLSDPGADPARATRAHLLLSKVLMVADRLELSPPAECAEFALGNLPLDPIDGAAPGFPDFARLLAYRSLRKDMAAASDALVDVLLAARPPRPARSRARPSDSTRRRSRWPPSPGARSTSSRRRSPRSSSARRTSSRSTGSAASGACWR